MDASFSSPQDFEADDARSARFRAQLDERLAALLIEVDDYETTTSTNDALLAAAPPPAGRGRIAIADVQTAGRGRHERHWFTETGASVCLSLAWTFARLPAGFPALALAVGVATAGVVRDAGLRGVGLKWPNDIMALDHKLGGILLESRLGRDGSATIVAGIGLNLSVPASSAGDGDGGGAPGPIAMEDLLGHRPARDEVAVPLCNRLLALFSRIDATGRVDWEADFPPLDWLRGRRVRVETGHAVISGTASGVGSDGSLLLVSEDGEHSLLAGTVRLEDAP